MERCRIVFSGAGGQGVITAAILLAEAAVLHENLLAVQSQTYGPAARGGATRSDVIISDTEIYYPKVIQPNVLVCLTQEAFDKFHTIIRPGGLLITDTRYVKTPHQVDARRIALPMYRSVMETIGKPVVFNICVLGVLIRLTKLVQPASIFKVLGSRISPDWEEMNREALELGMMLAGDRNSA